METLSVGERKLRKIYLLVNATWCYDNAITRLNPFVTALRYAAQFGLSRNYDGKPLLATAERSISERL